MAPSAARTQKKSPSMHLDQEENQQGKIEETLVQQNVHEYIPAVDTLACEQDQAFEFYMRHGFVVVDLGDAPDVYSAVGANMAKMAATTPHNRGHGRTCVNDWENLSSPVWEACHNMIETSPIVSALLPRIAKHFRLSSIVDYDAGGDYVEPLAPGCMSDPTWDRVGRHPTLWHRDTQTFADWFVASVLVHQVAMDQAPMQIQSWSGSVNASFHGRPGLCLIRDAWCVHRATPNHTAHARAMPSFRFRGNR